MDSILKDYGWCQVIKSQNDFVLRFDSGGVAVKMVEYPISKQEAEAALIDQLHAENIVIAKQKNESTK